MLRTVIPALLACVLPVAAQNEKPEINKIQADRGRATFIQRCGFCHGNDARGNRAPDLIRSPIVLRDEKGDLIGRVVRAGIPDKGMPAFALHDEEIADIAAFLHGEVQKALASAEVPADYAMDKLLTGNAAAGHKYFDAHCASCHSVNGDLAGVASKYKAIDLEAAFLYPDVRFPKRARITTPSGETVEGRVVHLDDFNIAIRDGNGVYHSFDRRRVRAEITDPLATHRELLFHYTDADMHDLFAYLATLTQSTAAH